MKIVIPTENDNGLESRVFAHFGSAPFFMVVDVDTGTCEAVNNTNMHHQHGMCHPLAQLSSKEIGCVVCGGMGMRAVQKLNESGIKAYKTAGENITVKELMEEFKADNLTEITPATACTDHGCH